MGSFYYDKYVRKVDRERGRRRGQERHLRDCPRHSTGSSDVAQVYELSARYGGCGYCIRTKRLSLESSYINIDFAMYNLQTSSTEQFIETHSPDDRKAARIAERQAS